MTRQFRTISVICLGVVLSWPGPVDGQTVSGSVVEAESAEPLPGTFVVLLDTAGTERARGLTTQSGTFRLGAPGPGSYRIRVERIGIADVTTASFTISGREAVSRQIRVPISPVRLTDIEVSARALCEMLQEDAVVLIRVWEEARKALEATSWTGRQTYYRFDALLSRQDLDRRGAPIGEAEFESIRLYGQRPFRAARADDLAFGGWVQPVGEGGVKFYGPDAEILLSESFRRRHCYSLRRKIVDGRAHIGVQFVPLPERRLPDISGVLWIDAESSELRSLDFRYEVLDLPFDTEGVGGHVEFARLPDGAWIVRRWIIRTPIARFARSRSFSGRRGGQNMRLVGLYEEGQQVTAVWRTSDLAAGPENEIPEGVPAVNAPTDQLIIRYPTSD